jgi:putative DNA primase/helicase
MSLLQIPEELKSYPNWVGWKWEQREDAHGELKWTKPPYDLKSNGTLRSAKTNDSTTWAGFDTAVAVLADHDIFEPPRFAGAGFVLPPGMGGVDFDGVLTNEKAEPYVLEILKHLGNPHCEITPSDTGLRAFFNAPVLPREQGRKFHGKQPGTDKYGAEIYFGVEPGRYLTVTGSKFSGDGVSTPIDIDLVHLLISQIGNAKFKSLWMGDTTAYSDDQSSADLALISILARLLNGDRTRIEKYFGASALGQREKWTDRPDYRKRTIDAALKGKSFNKDTNTTSGSEPAVGISRNADAITPKRLKWLWEHRIPIGKIALYAGNPDNGKSLSANSLAATVTMGKPFPDSPNMIPPSDVLMMLGEDDLEDTAIPRLMAAGADLSKIHFLEGVMRGNKEGDVRLDVDMGVLESKFQEFPNTRLLVIDPISNFLGETNMFGEQDARAEILVPLRKLAEKYGIAVLIVMHLNKKKDLDAISRVGGAMAFIGIARCAWLFQRDEPNEDGTLSENFTMSRLKGNLTAVTHGGLSYKIGFNKRVFTDEDGAVGAPFIDWGSVVHKTADQALSSSNHEVGRPKGSDSKLQDAKKFLEDALADGRKPKTELFSDAKGGHDITEATMRRAKDDLGIRSVKDGKIWYWELTPVNVTSETVTAESPEHIGTPMEVS